MKYSTTAALALSALLIGGCAAANCNCKGCPKNAKQSTTPVLTKEVPVVEETAPEAEAVTLVEETNKIGWERWALAGAVVGVGVGLAVLAKLKKTKSKP